MALSGVVCIGIDTPLNDQVSGTHRKESETYFEMILP